MVKDTPLMHEISGCNRAVFSGIYSYVLVWAVMRTSDIFSKRNPAEAGFLINTD